MDLEAVDSVLFYVRFCVKTRHTLLLKKSFFKLLFGVQGVPKLKHVIHVVISNRRPSIL